MISFPKMKRYVYKSHPVGSQEELKCYFPMPTDLQYCLPLLTPSDNYDYFLLLLCQEKMRFLNDKQILYL